MNILASWQYDFLQKRYPINMTEAVKTIRQPLDKIMGPEFKDAIQGKFVVDFGCGHGDDVGTMAQMGAKLAYGLELRPELVADNQKRITFPNSGFATQLPPDLQGLADMVISIDAFEHFSDPAFILGEMYKTLKPGGEAWISFGPTWLHPYGGHLFSVFPWAHLLMSEKALIAWRAQYFKDGATRFEDVGGGLNRMTIARFEKIVAASPFKLEKLHCNPLKGKRWLQLILGRELATGLVAARLRK